MAERCNAAAPEVLRDGMGAADIYEQGCAKVGCREMAAAVTEAVEKGDG